MIVRFLSRVLQVCVLTYVQKGQEVLLAYRGKPIARLEPVTKLSSDSQDPFYVLDQLADAHAESVTNQDIDGVVYGS